MPSMERARARSRSDCRCRRQNFPSSLSSRARVVSRRTSERGRALSGTLLDNPGQKVDYTGHARELGQPLPPATPQTVTVTGSRAADARPPSACQCGRDRSGTSSAAGRHAWWLPPWHRSSRAMLDVPAHRRDNVSQWLLASQNFRAFLFNQIIGNCSGLAEPVAEGVRTRVP